MEANPVAPAASHLAAGDLSLTAGSQGGRRSALDRLPGFAQRVLADLGEVPSHA
jgi:hypothetical protein